MKGKRFDISFGKDYKKTISKILLIVLIIGHLLLIGANAFIIVSAKDVRIYPQTLNADTPDNETIILSGSVLIENDHWNSVSITHLNLNLTFTTLNGTRVFSDTYEKERIPRTQNTTLDFNFEFSTHTLSEEMIEMLNSTDSIKLNAYLSFFYSIYRITLNFNTTINDLGW
jgi:hypothetical protein